jgi:hypothetical protein
MDSVTRDLLDRAEAHMTAHGGTLADAIDAVFEEDQREMDARLGIVHCDGIPWNKAPLPEWDHECFTWTSGYLGLEMVRRCACGAMARGRGGPWISKNETRRGRGETPPWDDHQRHLEVHADLVKWMKENPQPAPRRRWWRRLIR